MSHAALLVKHRAKNQLKRAPFVSFRNRGALSRVAKQENREADMAKAKKQTSRGRKQDRAGGPRERMPRII
jgi:hypothetical protein